MKNHLAIALCAVSLTAFAQQTPKPLTAEQLEAYKSRAAGISNMTQTRAPAFSSEGELQRDSHGKVEQTAPGTSSMADKAKYFNGITGVTGYENQAEPGRGRTAAVKVNGTGYADFSCNLTPGVQKTVLGRVIKYQGCTFTAGSTIGTMALSMCSVSLNGGACTPQDFSAPKAFPVNAYDTLDGLRVGIGCNESNKSCRVTMDDSYSVAGNGAQLTAAAAKKVAESGPNSAQAVTSERYTSDAYTKQMESTSGVDACAGAAQLSAEKNGVVSTCDKDGPQKTAAVALKGTDSATCSNTPICLRTATRTTTYGQSCTRTFPLTGYSCDYSVPTRECTSTKQLAVVTATMNDSEGGGQNTYLTVPVNPQTVTNSCTKDDLVGANKVRTTEDKPVCASQDADGVCLTQTWVDYYTFPSKAKLDGTCKASPFPMSGTPAASCANGGAGNGLTCQDGGWWQRSLSDSECTIVKVDDMGNGRTAETITHLTESDKPGCGICTLSTTNDTCYAKPTEAEPTDSCSNIDAGSCTLTSSTPQSQMGGLTMSQQDVYSCTKSEDSCVEYDRTNLCSNGDMTFGTDKQDRNQTTTSGAMNRAMTDAALIDAVSEGSEADPANPFVPRIFGGDDSRCSKPVGFFSGILDNDCCRMNIDRPGGGKIGNKCSLDEVKLATARRSNFTVYLGEYCSHKSGWGPFKRCTENTQTYCAFKGLLPRIIQVQGRGQLAGLATSASSGSVEKTALTFNFYEGKGGWTTPKAVNGVTIVPWQYPSYCADPAKAAQALTADPNARECPLALTQWMAVCENPAGCGELPTMPEFGSEHWNLSTIDPLKNVTTAISRFAMVTGACDPASTACRYEVAAWPAGIGGRAVASKSLTFPLYAVQEQTAKPLSGIPQDISAMGDYIFRPVSVPGVASPSTSLPATVRIDYSTDGGRTFSQMNVPTTIQGTDVKVPGTTDVRITGGCDVSTNLCTYSATGTVTVTAKPWGSPQNPDCSGFTLGQVSVLDFSKMDLSEWIASITSKVQGTDTASLTKVAGTRTQQMLDARQNGIATVSASNPQALRAARITPAEEFGPFEATLRVHGNYPVYSDDPAENVDPVTSVEVDWGDCTIPTRLAPMTQVAGGVRGSGFEARHTYVSPDKVPVACGGGRNSISHNVKVRVYSKSGTHDLVLKVVNTWNTYTGKTGTNGGTVESTTTVRAPGGQ
jgi:hypothetical protein